MAKIRPKKITGSGSHYNLIGNGTTFFSVLGTSLLSRPHIFVHIVILGQVPNYLFILEFKIC
jgi:hypothetical protein